MDKKFKIQNLTLIITIVIVIVLIIVPVYAFNNNNFVAISNRLKKQYSIPKSYTMNILKKAKFDKNVLYLIKHPVEKRLTFNEYQKLFVNSGRIKNGVLFFEKYGSILAKTYKEYGVNPYVIVAILGIETFYGREQLSITALDALYTLAFYYQNGSDFFLHELEQFIVYTYKYNLNPFIIKSSYAGAIGISQFMPSNILRYGVGRKNKSIDLNSMHDAIFSVANYLKNNGWKRKKRIVIKIHIDKCVNFYNRSFGVVRSRKMDLVMKNNIHMNFKAHIRCFKLKNGYKCWALLHNFFVIMSYNPTYKYAMSVFFLSQAIKQAIKHEPPKFLPTISKINKVCVLKNVHATKETPFLVTH